MPTLLLPGNLEETKWSEKKEELDKYVPLSYIMQFFEDRIPARYGENPKIKSNNSADKILLLESSTGSGKSTLIPPEFYHRFFERTRKNIACTQPRTLTAIEIPRNTIPPFQTKEALVKAGFPNREPLIYGKNIGTQTGVFTKRPHRGIIYMTPGIIVQQMIVMSNEEFMKKYSIIIVDEAHERSLSLDTVLYMLKKFINLNYANKDCPFLIVMSATFDTEKFCNYLLSEVKKPERYKNIIKVKGSVYNIDEHFLEYDSLNYVQSIIDKVIEIHKNNSLDFISPGEIMKNKKIYKLEEDMKKDDLITNQQFRDILIFIKGPGEIVKLKNKINKLNSTDEYFKKYPVLPLGLTGDLVANQSIEYRNTVEKSIEELNVEVFSSGKIELKKPTRRIIISTNVAETGITIDTLKYVIEPGWSYSNEFNPCFATGTMVAKPITQSMYKQRRGRVGRKAPGHIYPIYTKDIFEKMQKDQYPDMVKDEITLDLLNILIKEVDPENKINEFSIDKLFEIPDFEKEINKTKINIYELDLLDLPSADSLHYSMEKLYCLAAINTNSIPTNIGFIINKFRFIGIESIKMILSGYAWDVAIQDLIIIAAFLKFNKDDIISKETADKYHTALASGKFTLFPNEQKKIISYSEIKTDLMLDDEFIRYILIFNEFQKQLLEVNIRNLNVIKKVGDRKKKEKYETRSIIENLKEWGNNYGISIKGLLEVIDLRETIINTMVMIGLNPFHNHEKSLDINQDKHDYICSIKQCIFEGYKLNIAVWNNIEKKYYSRKSHLPLIIENEYILSKLDILKYGDSNPKYIIYDKITYIINTMTNLYNPVVSHISVLDGFIVIDPNFDSLL